MSAVEVCSLVALLVVLHLITADAVALAYRGLAAPGMMPLDPLEGEDEAEVHICAAIGWPSLLVVILVNLVACFAIALNPWRKR